MKEELHREVTEAIIGACIEVHRHLGPGLLESIYQRCGAHEFQLRGIPFRREVYLPASYNGVSFDVGYRIDFVVGDAVVVELKCVEHVLPIHTAQLMTYYAPAAETSRTTHQFQLTCAGCWSHPSGIASMNFSGSLRLCGSR